MKTEVQHREQEEGNEVQVGSQANDILMGWSDVMDIMNWGS